MVSQLMGQSVPLSQVYDAALMDLDGVAFQGTNPIPHASEGIEMARGDGLRICFLTNNASRPPSAVVAHLASVGIGAVDDDVVTASQAGAAMVARDFPAGSPVLVVGGPGVVEAVDQAGLIPVFSAYENPVAVLQGYGPAVDWIALAEATYAIRAGAKFYATNLDKTLPTERGFAPGNGSLVAAVRTATGVEPTSAGKPEPGIFHAAARRFGATKPLVVGDRLDTDIAGANAAGMPCLAVLTGVSTASDLAMAPPDIRPTYVGADLRALAEPHPEPRQEGEWWVVGGARAQVTDGVASASGGKWIDQVRALLAASWHAADAGTHLTACLTESTR
ncbi:MAG: HAD-IIA family hydrolase [Bifidobacteriaceae bacterium]|jgi:HAD superfamily hydrolase (TIGR01450 family)|nr:HAD-IIA family hydrolase [Bifidobacteriaceae bacterium]